MGRKRKPLAFVFDLDGTTGESAKRQRELFKTKDMESFRLKSVDDFPVTSVVSLINALYLTQIKVIFLTGRDENSRILTEEWLEKNNIPYNHLFMREVDDCREDYIFKKEFYLDNIRPNFKVLGAFEDRSPVVQMWEELKVDVFHYRNPNARLYEKLADFFYKDNIVKIKKRSTRVDSVQR